MSTNKAMMAWFLAIRSDDVRQVYQYAPECRSEIESLMSCFNWKELATIIDVPVSWYQRPRQFGMYGINAITNERIRQIQVKGFRTQDDCTDKLKQGAIALLTMDKSLWPYDPESWNPKNALAKAGAMMAAAIDKEKSIGN